MSLFSRIRNFYKEQITSLINYCTQLDSRKTAFAIAASFCIGITPLFGFTFVLAISFGLLFRLNQFVMQSVHVLISPLQILLFYPFIRLGRFVFDLDNKLSIPVKQIPSFIYNHTGEFVNEYFKIFMAGIVVWIIISFVIGYAIYRIILNFFDRYKELKSKRERDAEDMSIKIKVPTNSR